MENNNFPKNNFYVPKKVTIIEFKSKMMGQKNKL